MARKQGTQKARNNTQEGTVSFTLLRGPLTVVDSKGKTVGKLGADGECILAEHAYSALGYLSQSGKAYLPGRLPGKHAFFPQPDSPCAFHNSGRKLGRMVMFMTAGETTARQEALTDSKPDKTPSKSKDWGKPTV